jgi:signal transduction histidine kinase
MMALGERATAMLNDPDFAGEERRSWRFFDARRAPLRELLALRFRNQNLENDFWRYYSPISLFQSRLAFLLASVFLVSDYAADAISYGLAGATANLLRIILLSPLFIAMFAVSFYTYIQKRYEIYISCFFALTASILFLTLFFLDKEGGNGLSSTVGFLNLFFILLFSFVMIGTRFHASIITSIFITIVFMSLLYVATGANVKLYYLFYQIFTMFSLCALLGFTREFVLRADFATQIELAEARLAKDRADARYLEWLRSLAAFLRHEVRHPVAQINSSLELIQLADINDSVGDYTTSASNGVQHVWNLIERASRATDAEAFVRQSHARWIDLPALLTETVGSFQQTNSGINFSLRQPTALRVHADPTLIKEGVGNLLSNAASFAQDQSTVDISLETNGLHALIQVANKGALIEGEVKTLFSPFFSTRSGPSSEHHGLGLYLVRLIAEQHDGTAHISNLDDGSGVVATIQLPLPTMDRRSSGSPEPSRT